MRSLYLFLLFRVGSSFLLACKLQCFVSLLLVTQLPYDLVENGALFIEVSCRLRIVTAEQMWQIWMLEGEVFLYLCFCIRSICFLNEFCVRLLYPVFFYVFFFLREFIYIYINTVYIIYCKENGSAWQLGHIQYHAKISIIC